MDRNRPYISDYIQNKYGSVEGFFNKEGNRILIKAGVGSGKTRFAVTVLPRYGRTLFITSRSITSKQTRSTWWGEVPYKISTLHPNCDDSQLVVCQQFELKDYIDYLIDKNDFKYIVIDEIHSVLSDNFSHAPFFLAYFIDYVSRFSEKVIIGVSACINRIVHIPNEFKEIDYCSYLFAHFKVIDLTHVTHQSKPGAVKLIREQSAMNRLYSASQDNKILYFSSSAKRAYKLEKMLTGQGIRAIAITSQINIRFGPHKSGRKSKITYKQENTAKENDEKILTYLAKNEKFPENIDVIIATTKLREGLNLKDTSIKSVVSELIDPVSLVQCIGRIRGVGDNPSVEEYCIHVGSSYGRSRKMKVKEIQPFDVIASSYNMAKQHCSDHQKIFAHVPKKIEGVRDEMIESMSRCFWMEKKHGAGIVRKGITYHVNPLFYLEKALQSIDQEEYKSNPMQFISRVLEIDQVEQECDKRVIEIIRPHLNQKLFKSERVALLKQLSDAGYNIKQFKDITTICNYEIIAASNNSYYVIQNDAIT